MIIADLSRYDPLSAVDLYDAVILNVEDPGFQAKQARAIANQKPWGTYSWVYPGRGEEAAQRAHAAGVGPCGAWLDYEQAGVSPADLTAALAHGDELGTRLGVYTYLYILPTVKNLLGDHPLWLAYYPGTNDGTYRPWYSDDARKHGALLHQYTSSSGARDLSVVLDEPRWAAWTGSTGDDDMTPEQMKDLKDTLGQWMQDQSANVIKHVEATLGPWMQEQSANVIKAVDDHMDKLLKKE